MLRRTRFHRRGGFHRLDLGRTLAGDLRTLAAEGRWRPGRRDGTHSPPATEPGAANGRVSGAGATATPAGGAAARGERQAGPVDGRPEYPERA